MLGGVGGVARRTVTVRTVAVGVEEVMPGVFLVVPTKSVTCLVVCESCYVKLTVPPELKHAVVHADVHLIFVLLAVPRYPTKLAQIWLHEVNKHHDGLNVKKIRIMTPFYPTDRHRKHVGASDVSTRYFEVYLVVHCVDESVPIEFSPGELGLPEMMNYEP